VIIYFIILVETLHVFRFVWVVLFLLHIMLHNTFPVDLRGKGNCISVLGQT